MRRSITSYLLGILLALLIPLLMGCRLCEPKNEAAYYFYVNGGVFEPGTHEWKQGLSLGGAIEIAGGFKPWAISRRVEVTRDGSTFFRNFDEGGEDALVLPGDMIRVSECHCFGD